MSELKDFVDRLKGSLANLYTEYKDNEVDCKNFKILELTWKGKADTVRRIMNIVDNLKNEFEVK